MGQIGDLAGEWMVINVCYFSLIMVAESMLVYHRVLLPYPFSWHEDGIILYHLDQAATLTTFQGPGIGDVHYELGWCHRIYPTEGHSSSAS